MTREFRDFIERVRNGIKNGEIKVSKDLSDFDLAAQFAIGKIGEEKGYPFNVTYAEIAIKIKEFAPELLESEG